MLRLREEGVVRSIGVGMNYSAPLARFAAEADVDVVMVAGRYTLLDRSAADGPASRRRSRTTSTSSPRACSTPGSSPIPPTTRSYDYRPATADELARARALQRRCAAHGVRLAAAAIRFPLRHPAVTGVVVGARTADEVRQFAADATAVVPAELWDELDD